MTKHNMTLRLTVAEVARDLHAILIQVCDGGLEVIVSEGEQAVAVIKAPERPGRKLSECIAIAKAYESHLGYAPVPDPEFAADVQAAIDAHREPLNLPPGTPLGAD